MITIDSLPLYLSSYSTYNTRKRPDEEIIEEYIVDDPNLSKFSNYFEDRNLGNAIYKDMVEKKYNTQRVLNLMNTIKPRIVISGGKRELYPFESMHTYDNGQQRPHTLPGTIFLGSDRDYIEYGFPRNTTDINNKAKRLSDFNDEFFGHIVPNYYGYSSYRDAAEDLARHPLSLGDLYDMPGAFEYTAHGFEDPETKKLVVKGFDDVGREYAKRFGNSLDSLKFMEDMSNIAREATLHRADNLISTTAVRNKRLRDRPYTREIQRRRRELNRRIYNVGRDRRIRQMEEQQRREKPKVPYVPTSSYNGTNRIMLPILIQQKERDNRNPLKPWG